jgi:hypothetical protein
MTEMIEKKTMETDTQERAEIMRKLIETARRRQHLLLWLATILPGPLGLQQAVRDEAAAQLRQLAEG